MKIVNLTPHKIVLRGTDGTDTIIEPDSAGPCRVSCSPGAQIMKGCPYCSDSPFEEGWNCLFCGGSRLIGDTLGGAALHKSPVYGSLEGLPEPKKDTYYIVSMLAAQHAVGRRDVFYPGTGPTDGVVRKNGLVVAVTRLIQAPDVNPTGFNQKRRR